MPKLPHKCAHYPDKDKVWSVCRCGDRVPVPPAPVKPPPTKRAPVWKEVSWEGIRMAVKPFAADNAHDVTTAVVEYLLSRGVDVKAPF